MKKMLMVASVASMIGQFNLANIRLLQSMGYQVEVACDFQDRSVWTEKRIEDFCLQLQVMKIPYHQIDFSRNVLNIRNHYIAYKQMKKVVKVGGFDFIHCHTPIAGVISRLVAQKDKVRTIYTAHGFHFYKGAPLKNWILFYPIEWVCSWMTDVLITINYEDFKRAQRHLHAKKTVYVPGVGIDTVKFSSYLVNVDNKRKSLGVEEDEIMLLSVGEISSRKNYETVIRAIANLSNLKLKYYICGKGELQDQLQSIVSELGLHKQVIFLGFRTDISELCQAADLFVFPSKQDGLSVALMEAIACTTPVICSDIRGNKDLIRDASCMFDASSVDSLIHCLKNKLGYGEANQDYRKVRENLRNKMEKSVIGNYENLMQLDLLNIENDMMHVYNLGGVERLCKQQIFREDWNLNKDAIILLSVGELNSNKNHGTIIRALARLSNSDIHYFIAGTGALEAELKELALNLGVAAQVHLLGFCNNISSLLRIADIFLLPSIREGLNVSLMEAMASGLPCICSNIRGNCDLIVQGKGGYRVDSQNVSQWAEMISKLLSERKLDVGRYNTQKILYFGEETISVKMKSIYLGEELVQ